MDDFLGVVDNCWLMLDFLGASGLLWIVCW